MLERWNPVAEMDRMFNDMERLLSDFSMRTRAFPRVDGVRPAIDLFDRGEELVVKAVIPGARPEDINVSLEQNTLSLTGRYGYRLGEEDSKTATWYRREITAGEFAHSFTLPVPVDAERAEAAFEDGVLTLTLPKVEQARAKRIPVRAAKALAGSLN